MSKRNRRGEEKQDGDHLNLIPIAVTDDIMDLPWPFLFGEVEKDRGDVPEITESDAISEITENFKRLFSQAFAGQPDFDQPPAKRIKLVLGEEPEYFLPNEKGKKKKKKVYVGTSKYPGFFEKRRRHRSPPPPGGAAFRIKPEICPPA